MNTRHRLRCIVGVLLLAFALRVACAPGRPLWYDEAFSVLFSSLTPTQMIRTTVSPVAGMGAVEVHPPLYPLLLHLWIQFLGTSPLAIRLLSVFLGMATVAALWRLADWALGRRTGLAVGLLVAVNPFHVAYSQEARMYTLLTLTTMAAAWGLLRALEAQVRSRSWRWWGLYAIGAALTMYTHSLGAFTLLALNLLALIRPAGRWRLLDLAMANLAAVVLYSPWLIGALPTQLQFVGQSYWVEPPGVGAIVRALMLPVFTFYEPAPVWILGLELFTGMLLLVFLSLQAWRRWTPARWFILLAAAPVIGMLVVSLWRPVYLERALLPTALFYLVALGWLLTRIDLPAILTGGLMALLLVTTASSLWVHYTYVGFPRPPFPTAIRFLQENIEPSDVVVHTNKLTYLPMHYYNPDVSGTFLTDRLGSGRDTLSPHIQQALDLSAADTITEAVAGSASVWLVYFPQEIEELEAAGEESEALTWMERTFSQATRRQFVDLVIVAYRRTAADQMSLARLETIP